MTDATTQPAALPEDWTTQLTQGGVTYPFVEDENANITGLGHQDPAEFVAAVNAFDRECDSTLTTDDEWDASYVGHRWAVLDADGERLLTKVGDQPVTEGTPGAVAITTLWGQR